jgi:hypothetical protein
VRSCGILVQRKIINFNGKKGSKVPVGKLTGKETSPDVKCKQTPHPALPSPPQKPVSIIKPIFIQYSWSKRMDPRLGFFLLIYCGESGLA